MQYINCPQCKREISDTVEVCPHCGYYFNYYGNKKYNKKYNQKKHTEKREKPVDGNKRMLIFLASFLGGSVLLNIILIALLISGSGDKSSYPLNNNNNLNMAKKNIEVSEAP